MFISILFNRKGRRGEGKRGSLIFFVLLLRLTFSILSKMLTLEVRLKDVFQYLLIGECNPFIG